MYQWVCEDVDGDAAGTFDDATLREPTWTAPENTTDAVAEYTISVTATCAEDDSIRQTASFTQKVSPVTHEVTITDGPSGDPNPVGSGGDVQCSVTAEDSRDGHTLTYQWTVEDGDGNPAGSFDDATAREPIWTAPANTTDSAAEYTISVTATCAEDDTISATDSYVQQVSPVAHEVTITDGPSGDPNPVASEADVQCSVTAEDSRNGHTLTYQWSAEDEDGNPAGSFDDATAREPIWRAPVNTTDSAAEYTISVTATCSEDDTISATDSYVQQVSPVAHEVTITDGPSGDPNPVASEADVQCSVTAEDSRNGHTLTYQWSAEDGDGNAAGSFDDATAREPIWRAPVNTTDSAAEYTITVTATCAEDDTISATDSYVQQVSPVAHEVTITDGPSGDPNPVASGGDVACSVTAEDSRDGHTFSYEWSAVDSDGTPAGSFDDPRAREATWTAPPVRGDAQSFDISVAVECDHGESATASFTQQVLPTLAVELQPGWNMVSLGQPRDEPAEIRELLGPKVVALFRWDRAHFCYEQVDMDSEVAASYEGYGLWALCTEAITREFTARAPAMVDVTCRRGWNLLGNPYPATADLEACLVSAGSGRLLLPAYHWDGRKYITRTNMPAGCGFWVLSTYSGSGSFQPGGMTGSSPQEQIASLQDAPGLAESGICIQLAAEAEGSRDLCTWLGTTADDAALKTPKPPMMPDAVGAYLDVEDGIGYARLIVPQGENHIWTLTVNSPEEEEVSLRIVDTSELPGDMAVWLTEQATGKRIDLRHAPSYIYTARDGQRQFEIELGERHDLLQVLGVSAQAAGDGAQISFTLSAAGTATVDVLNIAGLTIKHIITDRECEAGPQTVSWNGRSDRGTRVPSGMYLVRVKAAAPTGERCQGLATIQMH